MGPDYWDAKYKRTQQELEDVKAKRVRVQPGQTPQLYVDVRLAGGVKEVPEIKCANGKDMFWHTTLFFWVTAPGGAEQPIFAPARVEDGSPMSLPVAASTNQQTPSDLFPKTALAKPGSYTVRAMAGRLVSDPVTVVVEEEAKPAPAGPKALPAVPAPEPAPGPPAAGPQPNWQPGGNTVEAVDAASGKLLWKANLGFAIGNVQAAGPQWVVTAQDGTKSATLDAATGKTLEQRQLRPAPEPF